MTEFDDLADMAVKVRKSLHWSAFLLGCMVLILVIDLQLKRSIARQAVQLAELINRHTVTVHMKDMADGSESMDAPADDADHSGRGGSDHVDGSARVAEGDDQAGVPVPGSPAGRPRGPRKRPPGDGPRAARDTGT